MSGILDTCGWLMTVGGSIMIMNTPKNPQTGIIKVMGLEWWVMKM